VLTAALLGQWALDGDEVAEIVAEHPATLAEEHAYERRRLPWHPNVTGSYFDRDDRDRSRFAHLGKGSAKT
jgi:hypothetical protein